MSKTVSEAGASSAGNISVEHEEKVTELLQNISLMSENAGSSEEVVLMVGGTRAGKSTTRLLLRNRDDLSQLKAYGNPACICDNGTGEIGSSDGSSTTIGVKDFQVGETTWVDTYGFAGNTGPYEEILGIYSLNRVANQAKRLKFLVFIPIEAFHCNADRRRRTDTFDHAMQLITNVTTSSAVGLVVTMVENNEPWNNDNYVKNVVLKMLNLDLENLTDKLQKVVSEQHPTMLAVLKSVIDRKSVFVIRRPPKPHNVEEMQLHEFLTNPNDTSSTAVYEKICKDLIEFCNGLEYAELQSQCVGKLSAETENKLLKEIYPRILSEVNKFVNQLLELLIKQIKDSIQEKTEKNKNVELFNELSGLISEISVFSDPEYTSRTCLPSGVIERVVKIVGVQNEAIFDLIESMKISENQFITLEKFTNVPHHNGFSSSEFRKVLKFLQSTHQQIFETHKKELPSAIINNISKEINDHVTNIKGLYLERLEMWKNTPGHHLLSKCKLQEHIQNVKNEIENKYTLAMIASEISFLYALLDVALIKSKEEGLSQLEVLIKNYADTREMYKHYQLPDIQGLVNKPTIQIQSFLSEQLNIIQESSANRSGTKLIRDLENMCLSWKGKLLNDKIQNTKLENLSTNIQFLKNVVNGFEEYSLIQDTNSDTLDGEIRKFSTCFNNTNTPDIQIYWYHEDWETDDLEAVLVESWFTNVSSLKDDLNGVYTRFKYLFDLKQVVFSSVDVRNKTTTLMSESTNCPNWLEGLYKAKDIFYSRLDPNITEHWQELQIYKQDMQTIFSNINTFCYPLNTIMEKVMENNPYSFHEGVTYNTNSVTFEKCVGHINMFATDLCKIMRVLFTKYLEEIQNNTVSSQIILSVVELFFASKAFLMLMNKFEAAYLRTDSRNAFSRIDDITEYWTEHSSINNEILPHTYRVFETLNQFSTVATDFITLLGDSVYLQVQLEAAFIKLTRINAQLTQIIPSFLQELPKFPDNFLSYLQSEYSIEDCILSNIFSLSTSLFTQAYENTLFVLSAASLNVSDLYTKNIFPVDKTTIKNIFILVNGNIFVDTNIAEDGDIENFLLAAENLICTNNFAISFKAKHCCFRTGALAGENPGADGHHGENGDNGAQGCNICILTQNVVECQSLCIVTMGGNASDGQDGGNGAHGLDETYLSAKHYSCVDWCLQEFDSLLKKICQSVGMQVPELAGPGNVQRTPNVQISSAVLQRVCIFVGVYYAWDRAMNVICGRANYDPEMCICQLLEFIKQSSEEDKILYILKIVDMVKVGQCSIQEDVPVCVSFHKLVTKLRNTNYPVNWKNLIEHALLTCKSGILSSVELEKIAWAAVCGLYLLENGKEHPLEIEKRSGPNLVSFLSNVVMKSVMVSLPFTFTIIPLTRAVIEATTQPATQPATRGGAGGNGGNGGKGGCPGFISLYNSVEKESTVQLLKIHGNGGKAGNGGKVGTAGCSRYEPVGEEKSNGKPGVDNSGKKCAGNCDKFQEMENNMASILSNTLLALPNDMDDISTKILLKHDWPFKFPVFTVNSILDMYLRRISMYTKTNLFSKDRLDYENRFQNLCEKLTQTSNFNSANLLFLPDVMACSYKMSDVVHTHIHSPQIVVNLKEYLKCCADTIKNYKESKQLFTSTSCHQKFRRNLQEEINKTKHIIRDNVLPQLNKVKSMFLQQIKQHKNDLNTCLSILKEAQKFENVLKLVSCLQWLSSRAENLISPAGVKVATGGLAGVAWLVTALKPSLSPPAAIQGNPLLNQERLQAEIQYLLEDYIKQIQKIVKKHPEFKNIFAAFLDKLKTLYNNFKACESETQNDGKLSEYFCQFYELQTEICEAITKHREQYSEKIDQAHALGVLYIELGVSRANCELYNKNKDTLLNRIKSLFSNSSEIRGVENRTELSETIYAPKLKFFLDFIESELAADSYSSSRYWKLKDVLVTLKHNLHSFTEGLPSEKEYELCFIKLEQAIEQYSELWKSIESSSEQIKLADFIAGSRMIDEFEETDANSETSRKVTKIKMLTRAQLVLLEYHNASIAIKQWAFPYAEKYTNITQRNALQISQLYGQNTEAIKTELRKEADACAQLLEEFKTNYNFEQAIHTREDEIWTTEHFYSDKGPFYEWDCAKYPIEIRKLLVGFPVKLCAKLNENHDGKGAIKTNNTIRLQFRHKDGTEYQTELDNCLKQFNLHMTHDGNSFYKVDGNVYKISHNQLTFVDNAVSGKDVSENNSRYKTKDYLLSPFTEWTFQLVLCEPSLLHNPKGAFTELADKFGHRVVLQLVGTGIYLNEASARWNELKPTTVHSHYQQINDYQSE